MAIPIVTGKMKVYRADPEGHTLRQIYPEVDQITGDPTLTVAADCQPLKATETVLVLPMGVSGGVDEPGNQIYVKIFADWENPAFYLPQVDDTVYYQDTSGDAQRKTAVYKQVQAEDPHTGTRAAHVKLTCVRQKEDFAGFPVEGLPLELEQ
jgi:hypothetical protein